MASLTLTWYTMHDRHVCKICEKLEGYHWTFLIGQDQFPNELIHPTYGIVWNSVLGAIVHGHRSRLGCRCTLLVDFEFEDLLAKVQSLYNTVQAIKATEK